MLARVGVRRPRCTGRDEAAVAPLSSDFYCTVRGRQLQPANDVAGPLQIEAERTTPAALACTTTSTSTTHPEVPGTFFLSFPHF